MDAGGTDIVGAIKKGYYFFEDRYYKVLDKINKVIPIYKIVDPIDKVFPSFILLISLVLFTLLLFLIVNPFAPGLQYTTILKVTDQSNKVLEGATIVVSSDFLAKSIEDETDDFGELSVSIPADEFGATVSVSLDGYATVEKEITLTDGDTKTIKLSRATVEFEGKAEQRTILLYNSVTGRKIDIEATVEFSCASGQGNPISQTRSDGTFKVTQPANCGRLTATARANGFKSKSRAISQSLTRINLESEETTGKILVTVKTSEGDNAPDVSLSLLDSTTNSEVASGSTSSSGTFQFTDVQPGTYKINAAPLAGAPTTKTGINVQAGRSESVVISLPEVLEGKNLFIKVIDANAGTKVVNAKVVFYSGAEPLNSGATQVDGTIRQQISDASAPYSAVVTHPDFLTSIVPSVPVQDAAETEPFEVELTRKTIAPPHNYPLIFVKVIDEESVPVSGASIVIYHKDYPNLPLNYPAVQSNADGNYVFDSLHEGTYFVLASKNEASGESEEFFAPKNESVFISVVVVLGEGDVEVVVSRAGSEEMVENATVEFINVATNEVLDSCTTDIDGECASNQIPADKKVYVKASAPTFLSSLGSREIDIVNNSTAEEHIELISLSDLPTDQDIMVEFVKICDDATCDGEVNVLESDADVTLSYFARFNLLLLKDSVTFDEVVQHIRAGSNTQQELPSAGYGIRLEEGDLPAAGGIPSYLSCWDNTSNFFERTDCTDRGSYKMVNFHWTDLGQILIPVTVKFNIEPGLEDGEEIRLYYEGQADTNTDTLSTPEKVEIFSIGEVFCGDNTSFAWRFELENEETNERTRISAGDDDDAVPIQVNSRYVLDYWVYNCSGGRVSSAVLNAENIHPNDNKPIEFRDGAGQALASDVPIELFSQAFPNSTDLNSATGDVDGINMFTVFETGGSPTEVRLRLTADGDAPNQNDGSEQNIFFEIEASGELDLRSVPEKLSNVALHPGLEGIVVDRATGLPIEGASVKVTIPTAPEQEITALNPTSATGLFTFGESIPQLLSVNKVTLEVRKAGYAILEQDIDVGGIAVIWNPDFDCIDIDPVEISLRRDRPQNMGDLTINTQDCNRDVEILIESPLVVSEDTFTLASTDSYTITVAAQHPLNYGYPLGIGEYPVYVRARFDEDEDGQFNALDGPHSGNLKRARIFLTDPTVCFRLADPDDPTNEGAMKSSFDLRGEPDSGLIVNDEDDCFRYIEDSSLPMLAPHYLEPPMNEGAFLIDMAELRRDPPEKVVMTEVLSNLHITPGHNYEASVTPNGGFVSLQWVDFLMTDGSHNGGDTHRVWAQRMRDGCQESLTGSVVGDCFNITGQYPYTAAQSGCRDARQAADKCPIPAHPIISNDTDPQKDGWVDTDTYHPNDAVYETQVSGAPIWQARHNICNNQTECTVDGIGPKQYFVGKNADKFILEVVGESTVLSKVQWEYWNYDIDHEGQIEFELVNNSVVGENYALLKVTDTIKEPGEVENEDVSFDWVVTAIGSKDWVELDSVIAPANAVEILSTKVLGVAASADTTPRTKVYNFDTSLNLHGNLNDFFNDEQFQLLVADLGANEIDIDDFALKFSQNATCKTNECMNSLFVLFYTGSWDFALNGADMIDGNGELINDGIFTMDFLEIQGAPQNIRAYAIIHDGEQSGRFTVESLDQNTAFSEEETNLATASGTGVIPAGQSKSSAISFSVDIPDSNGYEIEYYVSTDAAGVSAFFDEIGAPTSTSDPNAQIIGEISTRKVARVENVDYIHVRLVGQEAMDCIGFDNAIGATGEKNKPRVRFNWQWDLIDKDLCSQGNENYIYCDSTQFTISLLHRLEEIRALAQLGINEANLATIHELREFNAYLIEDSITEDFRKDLKDYLINVASPDPQESLLADDHPWQEYLEQGDDYSRLNFSNTVLEAGLYNVSISFSFDLPQLQYNFFGGDCIPDCGSKDLIGTINVSLEKISGPPVNSPFYRLPFDGSVGELADGGFDRQGYGVFFTNVDSPIVLIGDLESEEDYLRTVSDSGFKELVTIFEEDISFLNAEEATKGQLLTITKEESPTMEFSPSIATPVLLEMNSPGGASEAFYYLLKTDTALTSGGIMSMWFGTGSTMGDGPSQCRTFGGAQMPYIQKDQSAQNFPGACAAELPQSFYNASYGFKYDGVEVDEKVFFETVFFIPESMKKEVVLIDSCGNSSSAVFHAPSASTAGTAQLDISMESQNRIVSVQDVIDFVGDGRVCVYEDSDKISFRWNPQRLIDDLDEVKANIPGIVDWETDARCNVKRPGVS